MALIQMVARERAWAINKWLGYKAKYLPDTGYPEM